MIRLTLCCAFFLIGGTVAIDLKWDFSGWSPIEGPCATCFQVKPQEQQQQPSESRKRRQYVPTQEESNDILPARVQLVYLPEGSLEDLRSAQVAKFGSSLKSQIRRVRTTNFRGFELPTFREISPRRPTALVAERGKEAEALKQIELLEAALKSQQFSQNDGELPRVFIAPTHIPPPPGYVKIPLLPNRSSAKDALPGTFLTSDSQQDLSPGFVQVPLPENIAQLSHGIPFVHPSSSPHLMAHFSPAGSLPELPFKQPQPPQSISSQVRQPLVEVQSPNLIPIPPKSILQNQKVPSQQQQRTPHQSLEQTFRNNNPSSLVQVGTSVIRPQSNFLIPQINDQRSRSRSREQIERITGRELSGRSRDRETTVQRLVPQPVNPKRIQLKVVEEFIPEQNIPERELIPEQVFPVEEVILIEEPIIEHSLPVLNPQPVNTNPRTIPEGPALIPVRVLNQPQIEEPRRIHKPRNQTPPRIRINSLDTVTDLKEEDELLETISSILDSPQPVGVRKRPQGRKPRPTERLIERPTERQTTLPVLTTPAPVPFQTTQAPVQLTTTQASVPIETSTLFPPFSVARQKSRQQHRESADVNKRVHPRQRPNAETQRKRFGSRLRSRGRRPTNRSRTTAATDVNSPTESVPQTTEESVVAAPAAAPAASVSVARGSRKRVRIPGGSRGSVPNDLRKKRRRVLSRVRKVSRTPTADPAVPLEGEFSGAASAKVLITSPELKAPSRSNTIRSGRQNHRPDVVFGMKKKLSVMSEMQAEPVLDVEDFIIPESSTLEQEKESLTTLSPFDSFFDTSSNDSIVVPPSGNETYVGSNAHIIYAVALAEPLEGQQNSTTSAPTQGPTTTEYEFGYFTTEQSEPEVTTMEDLMSPDEQPTTEFSEQSTTELVQDSITEESSFNFLEKFFPSKPLSPNQIPDSRKESDGTIISKSVVTEVRSSNPVICYDGNCVVSENQKS